MEVGGGWGPGGAGRIGQAFGRGDEQSDVNGIEEGLDGRMEAWTDCLMEGPAGEGGSVKGMVEGLSV